jgi:GTPase SAR1 family protein
MRNVDYIPSDEDILMARIRTTGLESTTMKFGQTTIKVTDTGGERSERRKWPHALKDAQIVIFTVDVSSFDRVMLEDSAIYQLDEDVLLYDAFSKSKHFIDCHVLLVFTKVDILEARIRQAALDQWLPNNISKCRDVNQVKDYIATYFQEISRRAGKPVMIIFTSLFSTDENKSSTAPEKLVLEALLSLLEGRSECTSCGHKCDP